MERLAAGIQHQTGQMVQVPLDLLVHILAHYRPDVAAAAPPATGPVTGPSKIQHPAPNTAADEAAKLKVGDGDHLSLTLTEFQKQLAVMSGEIRQGMSGLHKKMDTVRDDYAALRTAKARLEKMQAEKMFAFTHRIDPQSFRILCAVLAQGDVAKASRALNMEDSTLRKRMAGWPACGPAYKVLVDLVRWRKKMGRKGTVALNESITKGTAAPADYAGLLSDVMDELLAMNEGNWEQKAEELADLLRPHVPR